MQRASFLLTVPEKGGLERARNKMDVARWDNKQVGGLGLDGMVSGWVKYRELIMKI